MRTILCALAFLLLTSAAAWADHVVMTVDGLTYESIIDNNDRLVYRVNGKNVGSMKYEKPKIIYLNEAGEQIGSAVRNGHVTKFFDQNGKLIAVEEVDSNPYAEDLQAVYKDSAGNVIGSAKGEGCFRMNYMDAAGNVIGSADTNALISRPFPVENWLLQQRNAKK
ncbi:MAG: hypothetical protein Q4F00_02485 [bacterium]|nr:hypothetical protein [bacterium]